MLSQVDILFFGGCSERRSDFMTLLQDVSTAWAARGRRRPLKLELRCIHVWHDALLDEERDYLVKRAKVVVNVHTYPSSSLEVHRLNFLLSSNKCVVSEQSSFDPEMDKQYATAVVFGRDLEDVAELAIALSADEERRSKCEGSAAALYHRLHSDRRALERTLKSVLAKA